MRRPVRVICSQKRRHERVTPRLAGRAALPEMRPRRTALPGADRRLHTNFAPEDFGPGRCRRSSDQWPWNVPAAPCDDPGVERENDR